MKQSTITLDKKIIVGLSARTGYNQLASGSTTIKDLHVEYFSNKIWQEIPNSLSPETTICVYSNYSSNYLGDYDFHIGTETSNENHLKNSQSKVIIPAGKYIKFTTEEGKVSNVIYKAWQEIWHIEDSGKLGATRSYISDFEVWDSRATNPEKTIIDIYIGLKDE